MHVGDQLLCLKNTSLVTQDRVSVNVMVLCYWHSNSMVFLLLGHMKFTGSYSITLTPNPNLRWDPIIVRENT